MSGFGWFVVGLNVGWWSSSAILFMGFKRASNGGDARGTPKRPRYCPLCGHYLAPIKWCEVGGCPK